MRYKNRQGTRINFTTKQRKANLLGAGHLLEASLQPEGCCQVQNSVTDPSGHSSTLASIISSADFLKGCFSPFMPVSETEGSPHFLPLG